MGIAGRIGAHRPAVSSSLSRPERTLRSTSALGRDRSLRVEGGEAPRTAVALRLGSGTLLHGPGLPPEAAKARCEAEVRGNRKEGLHRTDRTPVEDAEGQVRPPPAAAHGGGRSDGEDRARPRSLRALSPASGSWRCDAGRDLLRPDARASLSDPASPRQAGRSPNGSAVSHRVPRRGAASAGTDSTSSLKGGHPGETSVDVCAHRRIVVTEALVCARQRPPQFPLRPYNFGQFPLQPYRTTCLPRSRAAARRRSLEHASSTSSSATSASTRRIAHPSILCGHESKVTVLREGLAEVSGDRAQIASAMAFPTSSVRAAPPMSGVWGPKARIFSMAAKTASPASGCPR